MSAPIPSFFKIRLVLLLIGFFVLFFFVGLVRNVFAVEGCNVNGECVAYYYYVPDVVDCNQPSSFPYRDLVGECPKDLQNNSSGAIGSACKGVRLKSYRWTGTQWAILISDDQRDTTIALRDQLQTEMESLGVQNGQGPWDYWPDGPPADCSSSLCSSEAEILAQQCGGEGTYYINEETCDGHCRPDANCAEEYEQKSILCGGPDNIQDWDNETCTGTCFNCRDTAENWGRENCGDPGYLIEDLNSVTCDEDGNYHPSVMGNPCLTCADVRPRCEAICGGSGGIEVYRCEDDTSGTYPHIGSYTCECLAEPVDCGSFRLTCETRCGGPAFITAYHCDDNDQSNRICDCVSPPDEPPDDGLPEPTEDPVDPDTVDPNDPPEPDTDDHGLLGAIETNTRQTVQNTNAIGNQLSETNQSLEWIGNNNQIIADNTAKIENSIDELTDAVRNQDSSLPDINIEDETAPILQDISDGSFTQPNEFTEYGDEEYDFGNRFTDFIEQMKTTGLFSLPDQLTQNIPTGGSPVMTIDAGQYGTHDFDFSDWGNSLLILRSVCLLVFSWVGIRIVLLKR